MTEKDRGQLRQSRIGPYRIDRWLGTGEQGPVYLGHHEGSGTAAAVRLLRPELLADREPRDRLRRQLLAQCRPHTGAILVQDLDVDAELPWVATEYVDGPTLATELAGGQRLAGTELDRLAVATVIALRALHQDGIVHRDVAPSRVRRAPSGNWLVDIGTGATPAYQTPEQLRREVPTAAVDVFAWGAMLTEAATGRPPFGSDAAAGAKILAGEPDLGELPAPLRGLVAEALQPDPDRRPSAAALAARLTELRPETAAEALAHTLREPAGGPDRTRPAGSAAGRRSPRQRWAVRAAAGAVAAAFVAAAVIAIVLPRGEPPVLAGEEITIGVVNDWDEGIAVSYLWKIALEARGAAVDMEFADVRTIYSGTAAGDYDIAFDAWLPVAHETYWEAYGGDLVDLGAWLTGAALTIAVNDSAPIDSLTELAGAEDEFGGRLYGIEAEAGLTGVAREVIDEYGLELGFVTESTQVMRATLQAAVGRDNVVVTLWRPIWLYDTLSIRDLEDPLNVLGESHEIHSIGPRNFTQVHPEIAEWVASFRMTHHELLDLERVMFWEFRADTGPEYETAAQAWLEERPSGYLARMTGGSPLS